MKKSLILSISIVLAACASTSKQEETDISAADDNKVFLVCEEFTSGTVTSRWVVKNTLDYAVKYTYKLKASSSKETILVLGKQSELISNYVGYCRDSRKPIFVSYSRY